MPKHKLFRIEAVKTFANVSHHPAELQGKWRDIFKNDNPITIELGCGRGDLLLALAAEHKDRNFIGVDLKGVRLWSAATNARKLNLHNVFFMCTNILDMSDAFQPDDISEFWITFPDPYPKKPRKRMTAERYLDLYVKICTSGAIGHVKTDDDDYYKFSFQSIADYGCKIHTTIEDVHDQPDANKDLQILTTYEKRHIENGLKIKYIKFSLPNRESENL
jgi:tRNA (guanine-N7-)-methyltransferase